MCGECSTLAVMRFVFLFKQKTAYEMRISDWSSDVCSSDLPPAPAPAPARAPATPAAESAVESGRAGQPALIVVLPVGCSRLATAAVPIRPWGDRKSVVSGKSVSVSVDLGGRRIFQNTKTIENRRQRDQQHYSRKPIT